jgi:Mor family transcriptional regulator
MSYVKANTILPQELLKELQKYVQGKTIYIPKEKSNHQEWGSGSGERKRIDQRNLLIKEKFHSGSTIAELAAGYFLSPETIKSIVYSRK